MARAAARAGDWFTAAGHYRALIRHRRATMNDRIQLGHVLKAAGDAAALDAYMLAATRYPLETEPQRQLGLYLRRLGREEDAIDVFARAAVIDPEAANIHAELNSYELSDDALDRHMLHGLTGGATAVVPRPNPVTCAFAAFMVRQARNSARRRDWPRAQRHYASLIRCDPGGVNAHVQLGHSLLQQGDAERALASYRYALVLTPRDPDIHLQAGHALKRLNRQNGAFASYLMAWRLQPGMAAAATELRALYPQIDDAWLRAAVDSGSAIDTLPGNKPESRGNRLVEPVSLERQYRPYFRFLAGNLALKD